jgi:hypothetical protein
MLWGATGPQTPTYAAGAGFFVLSAGSYSGNLGGLSGADAKCLSDLTVNDWMGKTAAQGAGIVTSAHIHAWLCDTASCTNAYAGKQYYFAVSGDTGVGGSYLVPDSAGSIGHAAGDPSTSDGYSWSALNYFGGSYRYWTGYASLYNGSNPNPASSAPYLCNGWADATASYNGIVGNSNASDGSRWSAGSSACNTTQRLICLVQP